MGTPYLQIDLVKLRRLYVDRSLSCSAIGRKFGVTEHTIAHRLKMLGISQRSRGDSNRKYRFDRSFFNILDTEEKLYWYGFLLADGSISKDRDHVTLSLHKRDRKHMKKFRDALSSNLPVRCYDRCNCCIISVCSSEMVEALKRHGLHANKSFTVAPLIPQVNNLSLMRHFWRGVVDGDGWIVTFKNKKKRYLEMGLCGSKQVVYGFKEFVKSQFGYDFSVYKPTNIYYLPIKGWRSTKVLDFLYDNSTIYLDRKYKQALKAKQPRYYESRNNPSRIDTQAA